MDMLHTVMRPSIGEPPDGLAPVLDDVPHPAARPDA